MNEHFPIDYNEPDRLERERIERFTVLDLDQIALDAEPPFLISDLLPAEGFGIVFGPPKSGKSFLLSDALFHVGMGREWAGKAVLQGAVIYVTGEGVRGFKRRMVALRQHYDVDGCGVPFGLIPVAPSLGQNTGDDQILIAQIERYLASKGNPPLRAVAIDTVARTMKGADENSARDVSTLADNCDRIGSHFRCLVLGVHHSGKDATRGSRGSNALDGAVDVMWSVERGDDQNTARIQYMKDGPDGLSWGFKLSPYEITPEISTCIVEITSEPSEEATSSKAKKAVKLPKGAQIALNALRECLAETGEVPPTSNHIPAGVKAVKVDVWRDYAARMGISTSPEPDALRMAFKRASEALIAENVVQVWMPYAWPAR